MTTPYPKQPEPGAVIETQSPDRYKAERDKRERWARPVVAASPGEYNPQPWICITERHAGPLDWPNLMFRCGGQYSEMRASWAKAAES